ncbi:MAG TPA: hypothetical protein VM754_00195 [Actinomycetota bacterium]|nr:hypothetical protein [Actinomycetota bacterium]
MKVWVIFDMPNIQSRKQAEALIQAVVIKPLKVCGGTIEAEVLPPSCSAGLRPIGGRS